MAVRKSTKTKRKSGGKTTTRRTTARTKTAKGRTTARKTAGGRKTTRSTRSRTTTTTTGTGKLPTIRTPLSKSNMIKTITDVTAVGKKDVVAVLECLTEVIEKHVKTGGPGTFTLPGMMKISVVKKKARPARKGINPFTGEEIMIKAKPASKAVKIKPLKKLKEMVTAR